MKISDIFFDISKDFFDIYVDIMTSYSKNSNIFRANVQGSHICMYLHYILKYSNQNMLQSLECASSVQQKVTKNCKIYRYVDMCHICRKGRDQTFSLIFLCGLELRSGHQHFYQAVNIPSLVHHSRPALDSLPGGGGALQGTSESL